MKRKLVLSRLLASFEACPESMRLGEFLLGGIFRSTLREDPAYAKDSDLLDSFEAFAKTLKRPE